LNGFVKLLGWSVERVKPTLRRETAIWEA
jgi:hypothetical protein